MSSLEEHAPFVIVQRREDTPPIVSPVTFDAGEFTLLTTAVPEFTLHSPTPTIGALPANVAEVALHKLKSKPAFAGVGGALTVILTVDVLIEQVPLLILHCNTAVVPTTKPFTDEVGEERAAMVALPLKTVHVPTPVTGVLAFKVVVVILQRIWFGPALAVVGGASMVIFTVSLETQGPLVIVHTKVFTPALKFNAVAEGFAGVPMVALP